MRGKECVMDRDIRAGWLLASKGAGGIVGCSRGSVGLRDNRESFFVRVVLAL